MSGSTILVTGGAGYIGSHAVLALLDSGRDVVTVDDLSTGARTAVPSGVPFYETDVANEDRVRAIIRDHGVGVVMHFAGSISAARSVGAPLDYYRNNTAASLSLIRSCVDIGGVRLIFSSSAAVYGAGPSPFREDAPTAPVNPYGASKLMTESMIRDLRVAHPDFQAISLRYFNVAGADPAGRAGQRNPAAGGLIDLAVDVALGVRERLDIWGDDYDTRDGSGERDFIHVSDLAEVHIAALRHLESGGEGGVFNCGYGRGHTVLEVVDALEAIIGRDIPTRRAPRRAGDVASAVANVDRLNQTLDWRPSHDRLDLILRTALAWRGWPGGRRVGH